LGWSERKIFVGPFGDAAFSMKAGEIKGPVKTQFGYHILKLDGIQPASEKTFDESRSELEAEYRRNEAERLFNDAQDQLADAALQNGTDIEVVARKAGLSVQDIPNFSRSDGGGALKNLPAVIEAAFSPDVLDGHLSSLIEVEKGRGVVLRATDHQMPQQKPFEAVRAEVLAAWKKQRGEELAAAAAADAVKRLKAGESWDAVAKNLGVTAQPAAFIARSDQAAPPELRMAAFKAPTPVGAPIFQTVRLADGDTALFDLSAVREDPQDATLKEADVRRQYAARIASEEAQGYVAGARAAAKVTLNPQALD
jgi:peptidyl-prolyl cis-trans isomerase D